MEFEEALFCLKKGYRVTRKGWNGKGMWLQLVKPKDWAVVPAPEQSLTKAADVPASGTFAKYLVAPFIGMKTADDKFVPWIASQTDLLADDWERF